MNANGNSDAGGGAPEVVAAARALALLTRQTDEVRAELARLRRDLAEVRQDFSDLRAAQLLEANERLVLAALHAETRAEAAISNLGELTHTSQRDALTGLPTRTLMFDRIESAIALARRHASRIAVLFLDLVNFKQINDTLGHDVGDQVLQLAARRLEAAVRESDTVSRHGGDEFLVLLAEISQVSDAAMLAEKMLSMLAVPAHVGGHVVALSASIGIAVHPEDGDDAAHLVGRADAAMYRAKHCGGGAFEACRAAGRVDGGAPQAAVAGTPQAVAVGTPQAPAA